MFIKKITICNKKKKRKKTNNFAYANLPDFCPLGCYKPIKNINLYAKFSHKSLILSKKVTLN